MINAVGREIPDAVLAETGKTVFQGSRHFDGYSYEKTAVKREHESVARAVNWRRICRRFCENATPMTA